MTAAGGDLVVSGLTKTFAGATSGLNVLQGVDLRLSRGEALAVTGPSGSGKSTLLYIIGTLDVADSGSVRILDHDPFQLDPVALAKFRNTNIGFIFQDHYLLPQCTVLENVLIPTLAGPGAGDAQSARARSLLERVGLPHRLTHRPAELSGGERQRVAICRALINQPPLLLADEPTGNLDQHTARSISTLLLELSQEQNSMLIVVTHSTELAARLPRQAELLDGKLSEVNR